MIRRWLKRLLAHGRGGSQLDWLVSQGMRAGKGVRLEPGSIVDGGMPWLIEIGDGSGLAPMAYLLAHDASTNITPISASSPRQATLPSRMR